MYNVEEKRVSGTSTNRKLTTCGVIGDDENESNNSTVNCAFEDIKNNLKNQYSAFRHSDECLLEIRSFRLVVLNI